jgi:hypothetical protein
MEGSSSTIRRILIVDSHMVRTGRFQPAILKRDQTLAIRNQYSLDALIVLLCLARKGEVLEEDSLHFLPAECAFDILPRVLYSYRPLNYRWEDLFACLERVFWKRLYGDGAYFKFPIETVRTSLRVLNSDPAAKLPRKSGNRLRVIGEDPLKEIEDRMARATSVT